MGNNLLNKAGERLLHSAGISFQNLLGISLLFGEMDSNFPGETGLDFPGEVLNCGESDSFEYLIYHRGTIFRPRLPGELARLLLQEERTIQPHKEPVETINLGTEPDRKEVKISAKLELRVKQRLIQMLHDYIEIFAWSYEDMTGLDTNIVVHRLATKEDCLPVK